MNQLIPMAAIAMVLAAWKGIDKGFQWLTKRQKQALHQFWEVSTEMFAELTEMDDMHSKKTIARSTRGPPPLPARTSHTQRVHDLEVQQALQYEDLSQTRAEMRLLQIRTASEYDDLIQCTLRHCELGTAFPYTALSYCWGDTINTKVILVDEQVVSVTQNLYFALRELRFIGTEYVWVDALCINQRETVEVQQQIQRMPMIYGRAKIVFAWLGLSDDHFVGLKDTFEKLKVVSSAAHGSVLDRILMIWLKETGVFDEGRVHRRLAQMAFPKIVDRLKLFAPDLSEDDQTLHANKLAFVGQLQNVLSREYWRRAWILQELTVAGDIRLRCGAQDLDFGLLSSVISEFEALHTMGIFQPFTPNHQHVFNVVALRKKWRPREPIHLLSALRDSFHTCSTKPHDKIYSLFGICFDSSRFVTAVDYDLTAQEVIRRMTLHSIRATRTIDIICMQNPGRDSASCLPSWAPHWPSIGSHRFNNRMIHYLIGADEHQREDTRDRYWRAASDSLYTESPSVADTLVLKARGTSIGFITNLSGAVGESAVSDAPYGAFAPRSRRGLVKRLLGEEEPRDKAESIFRTLTVYKPKARLDDENFDFSDLWSSFADVSLEKEEPLVHAWLKMHQQFVIHGEPLMWWSRGILRRGEIDERAFGKAARFFYHASHDEGFTWNKRIKDLLAAVTRALKDGLRLMETSDGGTGWAHPAAQHCDEIFLLQGCSMPVILRPLEGKREKPGYEVIGDAFVEGIMHGEAWPGDEHLHEIYLY